MRKKAILSGILAASVTLAATLGGCSLVSANNKADMEQVIATVNISAAKNFDKDLEGFKEAVGETKVIKRELISYFLNVGYSYVQSGYDYKEVFNMLVDALVNNAALTQYSTMYLLKEKSVEENDALAKYLACDTQVAKLEYLLGADSDEVKIANYSLMSSVNAAIDSYEKNILDKDSSSSDSSEATVPGGVDSEKDDYYPADKDGKVDYNVYTGYENYLLGDSGNYKGDALDGTTRATRIRAYNNFISGLISYNLVDAEKENLRDVRSLNYIKDEYLSQLKQRVINKYYDLYEKEQETKLSSGSYEYIQSAYDDLLGLHKQSYKTDSGFTAVLGDMSDSSFILWAPNTQGEYDGTYGFVYNILLPYSEPQKASLSALQTEYANEKINGGYEEDYYIKRNRLLRQISSADQRASWFDEGNDYAFNAKDSGLNYFGKSDWLFFENNLLNDDRYESLEKYAGTYAFNGYATEKKDGEGYNVRANRVTIDGMLKEFSDYINFVLGTDAVEFDGGYTLGAENTAYYENGSVFTKNADGEDEVDYSKLIYASGKVNFGDDKGEDYNRANLFDKEGARYKALSAVNELQYAYTTDTGVLSQYIGYQVEAGDTSYIKEFEYAAHQAVANGAGTFYVCAGDYGWHLLYVTYTFDTKTGGKDGQAQYAPDWSNIGKEGTFENIFYEWIKSNDVGDASSARRNWIIKKYVGDDTVTKYEKRYKDLLNLNND